MNYKKFDIKKLNSAIYDYIVLSTSFISPIDWMDEIENKLLKKKYSGKILLDLLLSNGYDVNRFFEIHFDGKKFNFDTLINVTDVTDDVRKFSTNYYSNNAEMIKNSVLSKPQRFLIKQKRIY